MSCLSCRHLIPLSSRFCAYCGEFVGGPCFGSRPAADFQFLSRSTRNNLKPHPEADHD